MRLSKNRIPDIQVFGKGRNVRIQGFKVRHDDTRANEGGRVEMVPNIELNLSGKEVNGIATR